MVSNQMTDEGVPLRFHDNSHPQIHTNFVLIPVDLLQSEANRHGACRQRGEKFLQGPHRLGAVLRRELLELFAKMVGNGEPLHAQPDLGEQAIDVGGRLELSPTFFLFILVQPVQSCELLRRVTRF